MQTLFSCSLWTHPGVANRTKPNQKSIELNWTQSVGLLFDWFGNRTLSNWTFSVSSINRNREFDSRTQSNQSNSIDPISSILFGRKTKRSQFKLNRKDLPGMYVKQFENKNISINPELKFLLFKCFKIDKFTLESILGTWTAQKNHVKWDFTDRDVLRDTRKVKLSYIKFR